VTDDFDIIFQYDRMRFSPFKAFPLPTILNLLLTYRQQYYFVNCVKMNLYFQCSHFYFSFTSASSKENNVTTSLDILKCTIISEQFLLVVAYEYSTVIRKFV